MNTKKNMKEILIQCDYCGYRNKKYYINKYGKCNRCKNILNDRAYFKYMLIKKLRLIKKGEIGEFYDLNKY